MSPMPHSTDGDIRIFCLNLRFGRADDGLHDWEHRKLAYPRLLRYFQSDFYAFQEAMDFQIAFLHSLLREYDVIGQRMPAPDYWQNNVIFYHRSWNCLDSRHFYLSDTPDKPSKFDQSQWPRQCTMGIFEHRDTCINMATTHFDFDPDVQKKSALLILEQLNQLPTEKPAIIMGDFNAGAQSSCIEALTVNPGNFKSALWPPNMGTHHQFSGVAKEGPIDWILYRGSLAKQDAQVVTLPVEGIYPSDHFPLTASFKFTG